MCSLAESRWLQANKLKTLHSLLECDRQRVNYFLLKNLLLAYKYQKLMNVLALPC